MNNSQNALVAKTFTPGLYLAILSRPFYEELFITMTPLNGEMPENMFVRLAQAVKDKNARIVSQEIFGLPEDDGTGTAALAKAFGKIDWPVTWIDGSNHNRFAGIQVWALSGISIESIRMNNRIVGSFFEDDFGRYCCLGNIKPTDRSGIREEQARETFENMERALKQVGMDFQHVLRTWLFNNDILSWYDEFNKVRNAFFAERHVFDGLVPASTSVGSHNSSGTALVAELLAVQSKNDAVKACAVPSPFQCPAPDYGSAFNRAVELNMPDHRRLFISGTASIGPSGETAYKGDIEAQIKRTMQVVDAILKSRDMNWFDVIRGVAYVRHTGDIPSYLRYCSEYDLGSLPIVITNNVICRDNLLFEIEVDAIRMS